MTTEMQLAAQNNVIKNNYENHPLRQFVRHFSRSIPNFDHSKIPLYFESKIPGFYLSSTWLWHGNFTDLDRILQNLIKNSHEALEESGHQDGYVEVNISIDLDGGSQIETETELKITIEDNGPGIPEFIFGAGDFSPNGTTTKENGTGTGLQNVKRLVEKLNGTITVENKLISGSKFTIKLPITKHIPFN